MNLIETITERTQDLRATYIEQTEVWAKEHFATQTKVNKMTDVDWCKYFNLEPRLANEGTSSEFIALPKGFYNTRDARTMSNMETQARRIVKLGLEGYVKEERARAERHYKDSVVKLADRLIKKGVPAQANNLNMVTGWVGVNFEVVIHINGIKVKAWTIIASGQVQRPHYRYLVK